jgi:hypothetical protein
MTELDAIARPFLNLLLYLQLHLSILVPTIDKRFGIQAAARWL